MQLPDLKTIKVLFIGLDFEKSQLVKDVFPPSYQVFVEQNISLALSLISAEELDVVVLDLDFDIAKNFDFWVRLGNLQLDCRRIVVSDMDKKQCQFIPEKDRSITQFITKPWHEYELKAAIDSQCALKQLQFEVKQLHKSQEELLRKQARTHYAVLKSQVNPHFLLNCLNTLFSLLEDKTKSEQFVVKLANVYRYILTFHEKALISLQQELQLVQEYLYLQQVRLGEALHFAIQVQESFLTQEVPPLSVQTLVENAIKHNLSLIHI